MKALALLVLALAVSPAGAAGYRYVRVPLKALTPAMVAGTGFIRDHGYDDTYAFGYLPEGRYFPAAVEAAVVELDAWEWATHPHDAKTLARRPEPRGAAGWEDFHTYETLTTEVKDLAARFPNLVTLESAGKSVDGRDLWLLRLTAKNAGDKEKPKLLYISSMHGDEVTGKEMMVYFIRDLLAGYAKDSRIAALLNNAELFIMPSMNPDGTERRQRWNANGVDLNRDFPNPGDDEFSTQGRAIETVALMELHRKHDFAIALNFHGGALCINIPWDSKPNPEGQKFGDDTLMMSLANKYVGNNEPMYNVNMGSFHHGITYGYEWYQVLGGMQDWSAFFRQVTHATLEISDTKWPSASTLPTFWSQNRESILQYFEGGVIGLHLKVTDAAGRPLPVEVDMSTATRTLKYNGTVHRPAVAGATEVTLRSAGFAPKTLTVNAAAFDGKYQTVVLTKAR